LVVPVHKRPRGWPPAKEPGANALLRDTHKARCLAKGVYAVT
jgi:hypothetical protein